MRHSTLQNLLDEMLANPDEIFITSNSKRSALLTTSDGAALLLEGDFSGTPEECEAEARRILGETVRKVVIAE